MVVVQRNPSPTLRRTQSPRPITPERSEPKTPAPARKREEPARTARPRPSAVQDARQMTRANNQTAQLRSRLEQQLPKEPAPKERPYLVPGEEQQFPAADESERTPEVEKRQTAAIEEAARTGKPVRFETSEGKQVELTVQKTEAGYVYTIDGNKTDVSFDASVPEASRSRMLSKLVDYHAQTPASMRDAITKVAFVDAASNPGLAGRFEGGDRTLKIVGEENLTESTFNHEMGHAVGYKLNDRQGSTPPAWEKAVTEDDNEISGYGRASHEDQLRAYDPYGLRGLWDRVSEGPEAAEEKANRLRSDDFAESYAAYLEAKESGPAALEQFRQKFPNRARYLEENVEPKLVDAPLPRSERSPQVA